MSSVLKGFNTHLMEFIEDLIIVFPGDLDIKVAKTTVSTMIKFNPTKMIKIWNKHICKYSKEIEAGNIEYFLEKDYSEDVAIVNEVDNLEEIIERLRAPIRNMGEENKQKAIKYIQNLNKLSLLHFRSN